MAQVVDEATRLMRCQYSMAALPDDTLAQLPTHLLTAQLKPTALEAFEACWAAGGVLCSIVQEQGAPTARLQVRLSLQQPVPAPPDP